MALISAAVFGFAYGLIAMSARKKLLGNSQIMAYEQNRVVRALQEGLGAIRDVLLDGTQNVYVDIYGKAVIRLRRANAENSFISQAPRYALETLALLLISGFVIIISGRPDGLSNALPILALLALGAQRLLPIMQQLYGNWSVVKGSEAALIDVLDLLEQDRPDYTRTGSVQSLCLNESICLENLSFSYAKDQQLVLNGIEFNIPKGSRVGVIGGTGGGKSTMMDLLMGLLEPTEGVLKIDGKAITSDKERASWVWCFGRRARGAS